jgi:hypothetical protein
MDVVSEEKKLKSINLWYILLLSFILIWVAGAYIFLYKKTDAAYLNPPPIVLVEGLEGVSQKTFTNIFQINQTNTSNIISDVTTKPLFETKDHYELGDVIVVRYFYIKGVVIDRSYPGGDTYTVLYKDHGHTLRTIKLPKEFLMTPTGGDLNAIFLLGD